MIKVFCTIATRTAITLTSKSKTLPEENKYYILEPIVKIGTAKQNRTLHPLLDCLYSWMLKIDTYQFESNNIEYDFRCADSDELKKIFKMRYGMGACSWEYVNDNNGMIKVYDKYKIPKYVVDDFNNGNHARVKAVDAISWTKYNKEQRANLITNVILIMKTIGVDSEKFHGILDGIKE